MQPKILIIHNAVPAYRRPFFEQLAGFFSLEVYCDTSSAESIQPIPGVLFSPVSGQGRQGALKTIRSKKFDAVVAGNWDSLGNLWEFFSIARYCRQQGIPYLVWSEEWAWPMTSMRKIAQPLIHMLVQNANAVIVPGTLSERHFLQMGVRAKNVFRAPNASLVNALASDSPQNTVPQILSLARFIPRKGLLELCRAFAGVRTQAELLLFGADDPSAHGYRQLLEQECYKLNIATKVRILRDEGSEAKKAELISSCDIFVLNSTMQPIAEPWGLVINEVMAFGKAIVASDAVGAAADLVQDEVNGFIVRAGDSLALTRALDTLLADSELRRSYGEASRQKIALFTYGHMVEGFRRAIGSVLPKL